MHYCQQRSCRCAIKGWVAWTVTPTILSVSFRCDVVRERMVLSLTPPCTLFLTFLLNSARLALTGLAPIEMATHSPKCTIKQFQYCRRNDHPQDARRGQAVPKVTQKVPLQGCCRRDGVYLCFVAQPVATVGRYGSLRSVAIPFWGETVLWA